MQHSGIYRFATSYVVVKSIVRSRRTLSSNSKLVSEIRDQPAFRPPTKNTIVHKRSDCHTTEQTFTNDQETSTALRGLTTHTSRHHDITIKTCCKEKVQYLSIPANQDVFQAKWNLIYTAVSHFSCIPSCALHYRNPLKKKKVHAQ